MSHCRRYQELIEATLAGKMSAADRTDLDEHCAECTECAELLALHENLVALGEDIPLPDRQALGDMRESVLVAATAGSAPPGGTVRRTGFFVDLGRLWRAHPVPSGLAAAAVLVGAVLIGSWNTHADSFDQALMQAVDRPVAQTASLDGYWDTPYAFANVSVRPQGQNQLALSFDVCRHVDLQVAQDSPLAREVLLHAILDPSSMGSRLRAMEITPQVHDSRLKEALILTMHNDPDATVRLNALGVLIRYPYDRQIENALLKTLGQDEDVQMRLTAMQELARRNVGPDTIRDAVGNDNADAAMAILRQAAVTY